LKDFDFSVPSGDFIGFAPVSFKPYLEVQDLRQSGISLEKAAGFYNSSRIFLRTTATRQKFFQESSRYSIINLFSHAKADTINSEPLLFMYDSVIHMNELQKLGMQATKLAILSACQTNVGRNATGEGIYSLARGFAAAGIPSVAATLWKADEQAMYLISIKFNEYLSRGMRKDEALQKAKLHYMDVGFEKMLPYFWSNMILIGNAEPIALLQAPNTPSKWLWMGLGAGMLILLVCTFLFIKMPGFHKIKAKGD
jgi:CHAT domain-containing protein